MNVKKGILFVLIGVVVFSASGCGPWVQRMREECPILACMMGLNDANEYPPSSMSVEWASRNILYGWDMYPSNDGAFTTGVDLNLWDSGFRTNVKWTRPTQSGHEVWEWFYFNPYYSNTAWMGSSWQTDYRAGWGYYYFPDGPRRAYHYSHGYYYPCYAQNLDFQEFYARFSWPRALPWGVVPYYGATRIWPSTSGRFPCSYGCGKSYWRNYGGWLHTFGVYKVWQADGWFPSHWPIQPGSTVRSGFEFVYNSGAGPTVDTSKRRADHDLSHCTFSLEANIPLANGASQSPVNLIGGVRHQVSMDHSTNNDNETWFTWGVEVVLDPW